MEGEDKKFEEEGISFGLKPAEIQEVRLRYQEALADFRLSENSTRTIEEYKEQLRAAFAC